MVAGVSIIKQVGLLWEFDNINKNCKEQQKFEYNEIIKNCTHLMD